jgi:hypothetical protein
MIDENDNCCDYATDRIEINESALFHRQIVAV